VELNRQVQRRSMLLAEARAITDEVFKFDHYAVNSGVRLLPSALAIIHSDMARTAKVQDTSQWRPSPRVTYPRLISADKPADRRSGAGAACSARSRGGRVMGSWLIRVSRGFCFAQPANFFS
jgi:hypothetical protein